MKKILMVDDEQDLCYFVKRSLEKTGEFQVTTTTLPEELMPLCEQEKPDLVILDIVMPHIRGEELVAALRKNPSTARVLILVTSGLGEMTFHKKSEGWRWEPNRPIVHERGEVIKERSSERAAQAYGVDDFLAKPFSPATLLTVINDLLAKQDPNPKPTDETTGK